MIAFWCAVLAIDAVMTAWIWAVAGASGSLSVALDVYFFCLPFAAALAGLALWAFPLALAAWDFALDAWDAALILMGLRA